MSAENENSAFIQSAKTSEQNEAKIFSSAVIKISDWQILQLNKHDNQLVDIQQVHHAQQE